MKIEGSAIVFSAAPGERNVVTVGSEEAAPDQFAISDGAGLVARAPCARMSEFSSTVVCPTAGIETFEADLGDGRDVLHDTSEQGDNTAKYLPMTVSGRDGDDEVTFFGAVPVKFDGGAGDDHATTGPRADELTGGPGKDNLSAGLGDNMLAGGGGSDELVAGNGSDLIIPGKGKADYANASGGDDTIDWRNGERDNGERSGCDKGRDTIIQDANDRIVEHDDDGNGVTTVEVGCERVRGQRAPAPSAVFVPHTNPKRSLRLGIDVNSAFDGRFAIEVLLSARQARAIGLGNEQVRIAKSGVRHTSVRTFANLRMTAAAAEAVRGHTVKATVRIRNTDSGGRRGTSKHRITILKF